MARASRSRGDKMENENKPKLKKMGKVAKVFKLCEEGKSIKEIGDKMKLSERVVRSYIWRAKNPEKYRELLKRYFAKKKQKQENGKKEA